MPDYYTSLYNQTCILFKPKPNSTNNSSHEEAKIVLDRTYSYSRVASKLAEKLNVEASKIRFSISYANNSNQPGPAIAYKPAIKLQDMVYTLPKHAELTQLGELGAYVNPDHYPIHVLFYEVMDVDVADLETKRSIEVNIIGPTLRKETKITAVIPRTGSVQQLLDQAIMKGKMETKDPSKIRLFEVMNGKVTKEFSLDQTIDNVATEKSAIVYAEAIPKDELDMNLDTDRLIQVVHYHNHPSQFHGIPFRFAAIKGEPFEETKKRLQKRTGLGDMDWKKVKFTLLRNVYGSEPQVTVIEDEQEFDLRQAKLQEEDALGLDHVDKSSKSRFSNMFDNGIFIRG